MDDSLLINRVTIGKDCLVDYTVKVNRFFDSNRWWNMYCIKDGLPFSTRDEISNSYIFITDWR